MHGYFHFSDLMLSYMVCNTLNTLTMTLLPYFGPEHNKQYAISETEPRVIAVIYSVHNSEALTFLFYSIQFMMFSTTLFIKSPRQMEP